MERELRIPLRVAHKILWDVYRRGLGPKGTKRASWERRISYLDEIPSLYSVRALRAALEEGLPRILDSLPKNKPISFVGTGESSRRAFYILEATMRHIPELFEDVNLARIAHLSLPFSPHHMGRNWRDLSDYGSIYNSDDYLPMYLPEITAELLGRKDHVVVRDSNGREYYVVGEDLKNDLEKLHAVFPDVQKVITRRNPYYTLYRNVIRYASWGKISLVHLDTLFWTDPKTVGGTAWYVDEAFRRLAKMHGVELPEIRRAAFVELYPGTKMREKLERADRGQYRPSDHEDLVFGSIIYGPLDSRGPGNTLPTHVRRSPYSEAMPVLHPTGVIYLTHLKPVKR